MGTFQDLWQVWNRALHVNLKIVLIAVPDCKEVHEERFNKINNFVFQRFSFIFLFTRSGVLNRLFMSGKMLVCVFVCFVR